MTHEQRIAAAYGLIMAIVEEFPALVIFPQTLCTVVREVWLQDQENGWKDEEFFNRYATTAGIVSLAGCTFEQIGFTLAGRICQEPDSARHRGH